MCSACNDSQLQCNSNAIIDATEGENPAITKRELCENEILSPVVNQWYAEARKVNSALPTTFQAFLDRAAADDAPAVRTKAGRIRWAVRVREGLNEQKVAQWCAKASLTDRHRVAEMAGGWILKEPPYEAKFQRPVFQIAMRIRYGLKVGPAIPYVSVQVCGVRKGDGTACGKALDAVGQHALACKCGGQSPPARRVQGCVRAASQAASHKRKIRAIYPRTRPTRRGHGRDTRSAPRFGSTNEGRKSVARCPGVPPARTRRPKSR